MDPLINRFRKWFWHPSASMEKPPDIYAGFTNDDWQTVALDFIPCGRFEASYFATADECQSVIDRIASARKEYDDVQPLRLRSEILKWLRYFERHARKDWQE